jgi:hypothetical protein
METNRDKSGTIFLSTLSQVALFTGELTGQISDGMWENSGPRDHWKFWCRLDARVDPTGTPRVETARPWECKKRGYAFSRLYEIIGDRMVNLGRMGRAAASLGTALPERARGAAEYMPDTLEEWTRCQETGAWQHDFIADYMKGVAPELAAAYYATRYGMKELRADVKAVRAAMQNVVNVDSRLA